MNVPLNVNNEIKFILKKRDMLSEKMSDEISDSWARCVSSGLNPFSNPKKIVISPQELKEARQKKEALRKIIIPELELLYSQVAGTNFMVAFSNEEGLVLDTIFDKSCLKEDVGKIMFLDSVEYWKSSRKCLGIALTRFSSRFDFLLISTNFLCACFRFSKM